jgi:toxin FitB
MYLSVVTIGEMRQGVEMIRHRGEESQASVLERC